MNESTIILFRDALDMPDATLSQMCERIRTLRQAEMFAKHILEAQRTRSGSISSLDPTFLEAVYESVITMSNRR